MTTSSTGRTVIDNNSFKIDENQSENKTSSFDAGIYQFEQDFLNDLERGAAFGERHSNSNHMESLMDNNAEKAMKIALEMTAFDAESGDDTTAASDLLLDLSGRMHGVGASSSATHLEDLVNNDGFASQSQSSKRRPPRKQQAPFKSIYQDNQLFKNEEVQGQELDDGLDNPDNDFAVTANRIKMAANLVRAKKEKPSNRAGGKNDDDLYLDGAADDPNAIAPFVVVGRELDTFYYKNKNCKSQKEFLNWTKRMLGFSKSTTYEYIISYRVYSDIKKSILPNYPLPQYQSHCQLLSKIPSEDLATVWMQICDLSGNQMTTSILEDYLKKNQFMAGKKKGAPSSVRERKRARGSSLGSGAGGVGGSSGAAAAVSVPSTLLKKKKRKRRRNDDDDTEDDVVSSEHFSDEEYFNLVVPVKKQQSQDLSDNLDDTQDPSRSTLVPTPPKTLRSSSSSRSVVATQDVPAAKEQVDQSADEVAITPLPFDVSRLYEVGQRVVQGGMFDKVCDTIAEFEELEGGNMDDATPDSSLSKKEIGWSGRVFCNLTRARPHSPLAHTFAPGIERLLQIIFTRHANNEYSEGIFLIRAEFGADWFTPILQHPFCILRQHRYLEAGSGVSGSNVNVFDSFVAFYMGPNVARFCNHFRNVGYLPGFNCWSFAPIPANRATRSSLGTDMVEPLNASSGAAASSSTFPKDFMLNDHHSVGSAATANAAVMGHAPSGLDLGVGGLEMPMEDLAASILSHLSQ